MFARLSAFVIWSLVGATAVFWALRLAASPPQVPAYAVAVGNAVAVRGDLGRLFGIAPRPTATAQAAPEAPSRFKLIGVMAPRDRDRQDEHGVALIAVDGKPPKPFTVGAHLDSDLVLQSVGLRTASLGPAQGTRSVLLELPALLAPNSGVLPPAGAAAPLPAAPPPRTMPAPLPPVLPQGAAPTVGTAQPPLSMPPNQAPVAPGMPTPGSLPTQ
jgi:general secretion pathway protein C